MITEASKAGLLAGGAVAAAIAASYVPKARIPLMVTAAALGIGAVYVGFKASTASTPGHAGGLVGAVRDALTGAPIEAGAPTTKGEPVIGGFKIGPGRITAPDGTVFDGIDPLGLNHTKPVTGRVLLPTEGGAIDRNAFAAEYLVLVELTNRTKLPISGTVDVDVTEMHSWLGGGPRTTFAKSPPFTIDAGATLEVPIVVPIAPAWQNNVLLLPTDARLAASFGGFVLASRNYMVL